MLTTAQPFPAPLTPPADPPLIELRGVNKIFHTSAGDFIALKDINLEFRPGEFVSIVGKSGSGKSTLINMITGIDHPTSGSVRVGQAQLEKMTQGELALWRGTNMGIVFQFFQLLPTLSILENTLLPMDFGGKYTREEREKRARDLLELVGLAEAADKLPAALSGGQQQTAAIARALANDPPILAADEPTGNLDSRTAEHILQIFTDLARQGKTVLMVTHDRQLAQRTSRQVLISDGQIINPWVAQALPTLPHPYLLRLTHQMERRLYPAGATLARQEMLDAGLFIIVQGTVEVIRRGDRGRPEALDTLGPGSFFSEIEMLETASCELTFRASPHQPVEVLALGLDEFNRLLSEHPTASEGLRQAALQRSILYCPRRTPARRLWRWLRRS